MRILTLFSLLGLLSTAYAQEPLKRPFYVGMSVGTMQYKEDMTVIDPELASFEDLITAWKIYGGYKFNEYFGLEGSYTKSDDGSGSVSGNNTIDGDYSLSAKADFRGYSFKAKGFFPTSWGHLFAGIGHYENHSDLAFAASFQCCDGETLRSSDRFAGLTADIGAQWDIESERLDPFILRVEYEKWDFREGSASVLSLGALWEF